MLTAQSLNIPPSNLLQRELEIRFAIAERQRELKALRTMEKALAKLRRENREAQANRASTVERLGIQLG